MNKEAYAEGYQYGIKLALDSCGVVKTAAVPGVLKHLLESASQVPGWAKGMAVGAPAGAGVGALAGGDLEDILSGALGGAALGGIGGGGAGALSKAVQGPGASVLERLGLGQVGKAKAGLAKAKGGLADTSRQMRAEVAAPIPTNPRALKDLQQELMAGGGAVNRAQQAIAPAAASQAEAALSPEILKALGLVGGGAGMAGAFG
ncbi:MAG: hypothetical protein DRJ03_01855 [Chloroflexi bacterium]|nr:MAG: hypothetical protein DRJ03_01855 [Chloroflexota bacterium]